MNVVHITAYVVAFSVLAGGTVAANRRTDGDVLGSGDMVAYALVGGGTAVGIFSAQFLLLRWEDLVNLAAAAVVLGLLAAVVKAVYE